MTTIKFKTKNIHIRKGEDEFINPGCFGLNLAKYIRNELRKSGIVAKAGAEDWGWYIIVKKRPYFQWIGCQYDPSNNKTEDDIYKTEIEKEWFIIVQNECGFIYRILNMKQVKLETETLLNQLRQIIINGLNGVLIK